MNVLVSSGFPWWNAEAAYAATVTRLLRAAGHQAWILAEAGTRNAQELERRGLAPVTGLPPAGNNPLGWPAALTRLRQFLREQRIDVVNVFRSADALPHLLAARREGAALVRTRGGARPERRSWINRGLYGDWADATIASCNLIAERLGNRLGLDREHFHTIYYPTRLPDLQDDATRRERRRQFLAELGHPPERLLLGVVGRIAPEKGHALLVAALERLASHPAQPLLLILNKGYADEGPYRGPLEADIRRRHLDHRVIWLGFREDVREIMSWVDVGVVPSVASEMNCRVAVEYFSVGTPVVACPTGALPEVVETGRSGEVLARPDPDELAAVLAALADQPERLAALGRGAREAAERRFNEADFLAATLSVYRQAIARRDARR